MRVLCFAPNLSNRRLLNHSFERWRIRVRATTLSSILDALTSWFAPKSSIARITVSGTLSLNSRRERAEFAYRPRICLITPSLESFLTRWSFTESAGTGSLPESVPCLRWFQVTSKPSISEIEQKLVEGTNAFVPVSFFGFAGAACFLQDQFLRTLPPRV